MCIGIAGGYIKQEKEIFICNRKKCEHCHPECEHTTDRRFAADEDKECEI